MKKVSIENWGVIVAFSVMGLLVIYQVVRNERNSQLLKKSMKCPAVLTEILSGNGVRSSHAGTYTYVVKGDSYTYQEASNFNMLKVGDTILIEYAVQDHSVARVVDKYYMQKYKYLKKKEN
jgi:hypothetical protein